MESSAAAFRDTFREVHSLSERLLAAHIGAKDKHLRALMRYAVARQTTSEYPFVFRYAFSRRERDGARVLDLAAAIHLLQSSAFISDDIMDEADQRYGQPAIHCKFGVSNAIVATELMQTIALETVAVEMRNRRFRNACLVLQILNQTMRELYVGQYLDVHHTGDTHMSRREYDRVIGLGVGNYFANVARCGALLAGKPRREVEALARYGYHYGMALFITDDIVDIVQRPAVTGKSYASDLKNRRMRLPVIYALKMADGAGAAFLREFLRGGVPRRTETARARDIIFASGALQACLRASRRHINQSLRALTAVEGVTRERLAWLSRTLLRAQQLDGGIPDKR